VDPSACVQYRHCSFSSCGRDSFCEELLGDLALGALYEANAMIVINTFGGSSRPHDGPVHEADLTNPSNVLIFQDYYGDGTGQTHMGGRNFACCDGRAKWQKCGLKGYDIIHATWWQ